MKGQWIGNYTGSSPGMIIVNVDERSTHYQGVAYLHESNPAIPWNNLRSLMYHYTIPY